MVAALFLNQSSKFGITDIDDYPAHAGVNIDRTGIVGEWYAASALLAADGAQVSCVPNMTPGASSAALPGAGDLLSQSGTGAPAYVNNGLNGAPSILLDGTNDRMLALFPLVQPCTLYHAIKPLTFVSGERLIGTQTALQGGDIFFSGTSPNVRASAGTQSGLNANLTLGNWHVVATVFNGASSVLRIDNTTETTGDFGANNPNGLTIGGALAVATAHMEWAASFAFNTAHDGARRAATVAAIQAALGI